MDLEAGKTHMHLSHSGCKYTFTCAACERVYNSEMSLVRHLQQTGNEQQQQYYALKGKSEASAEILAANGADGIETCEQCAAKFQFSADAYKIHKLQHAYVLAKSSLRPKSNSYLVESILNTSPSTNSTSGSTRSSRIDHIASKLIQQKQKQQRQDEQPHTNTFDYNTSQAFINLLAGQYLANSSWSNMLNGWFHF